MDTVTRERHERKWARIIGESLNSELSIENYCRERGICEQTYYRWRKRLKEKTDMLTREWCEMRPVWKDVPEEVHYNALERTEQMTEAGTGEAPVILYAGAAAIRIYETVSEGLLTRLLRAVNHAG